MAQTIIRISKKVLKNCIEKNGDLVIELDLDVRPLDNFPQGDEIFIKSRKDELPENYNSEFCLASNNLLVYVHDESFRVSNAVMRALQILYESMNYELAYTQFARRYSGRDVLRYSESNEICNSAIKHVNHRLKDKNVPVKLVRETAIIRLVIDKE